MTQTKLILSTFLDDNYSVLNLLTLLCMYNLTLQLHYAFADLLWTLGTLEKDTDISEIKENTES